MIPAIIWPQKAIRGVFAISPGSCWARLDNLQFRHGADHVQQEDLALMEMISPVRIRYWQG
jgi:hypothetical protein